MLTIRRVSQRGMTLIEVLIAISVLAILLMLAVPGLQTWMLNARIRTASEDMLAGVQLARTEAVRRNANVEFVLDTGAGWGVGLPGSGCPAAPGSCIQYRPPANGTAGVVVAPTPAGATTVTFNGLGSPTGAGNLTRLDIDLSSTVLPASETRELAITIGLGGEVRMCDPNVSNAADSRYC